MLKNERPRPVILYADDHREAHALLQRAFRNAEVKAVIIPAADGTEILQYLSKCVEKGEALYPWPSLLLLDLKMPKLCGFEVVRIIKEHSEWRGFPIVVFSSSEDPVDSATAKELGCTGFVKKAFDLDHLENFARSIDAEFFGGAEREGHRAFSNFCIPV